MKRIVSVLGFLMCLALPATSQAQNVVKLLDPVNIQYSVVNVPFDEAVPFASKQLYLQCQAGDTATILGPYTNFDLIVDNFIQVQGPDTVIRNYCPNLETYGCFVLNDGEDPGQHITEPAESIYHPVSPQDVSASLVPGLGLYTFSLMDYSYTYTSSELSLSTSCAIKDKICHVDSGKKGAKTLTVGAAAIPAHLRNHLGDHLGECTGTEGR